MDAWAVFIVWLSGPKSSVYIAAYSQGSLQLLIFHLSLFQNRKNQTTCGPCVTLADSTGSVPCGCNSTLGQLVACGCVYYYVWCHSLSLLSLWPILSKSNNVSYDSIPMLTWLLGKDCGRFLILLSQWERGRAAYFCLPEFWVSLLYISQEATAAEHVVGLSCLPASTADLVFDFSWTHWLGRQISAPDRYSLIRLKLNLTAGRKRTTFTALLCYTAKLLSVLLWVFLHLNLRFLCNLLFFSLVLRSITGFQASSCSTSRAYWHTHQYGTIYVIKRLLADLLIAVVNDELRSCDFLITSVRLNDRTACSLSSEVLQKEVIFNGCCVLL